MGARTCRLHGCEREAGLDSGTYRDRFYCSPQHEVKHEKIKADAQEAAMEGSL